MENNKIKIVFATGNSHKLQEINEISKGSGIEFILPPTDFSPDETGSTFEQNSYIKAKEAALISNCIALADDSGLCVEALNGGPGIHSARYAQTPQARIDKLLNNLTDVANRKAKFVCAMTLVDEFGNILCQETGECHGEISKSQSGINGFGYDPIFLVDGYGVTMADMSEDLKNSVSHRSIALNKVISYIQSSLFL
ncbi:MAG: RdgB/HAM1 family non-canonical purine NTP pyrophosphatase [Cyanobacteria bacterium SIG26]|nr:RdgB/HAM1 family non-canonical purine NTP pyrophosphatase [Cyanobacteria bacterium SIG26]